MIKTIMRRSLSKKILKKVLKNIYNINYKTPKKIDDFEDYLPFNDFASFNFSIYKTKEYIINELKDMNLKDLLKNYFMEELYINLENKLLEDCKKKYALKLTTIFFDEIAEPEFKDIYNKIVKMSEEMRNDGEYGNLIATETLTMFQLAFLNIPIKKLNGEEKDEIIISLFHAKKYIEVLYLDYLKKLHLLEISNQKLKIEGFKKVNKTIASMSNDLKKEKYKIIDNKNVASDFNNKSLKKKVVKEERRTSKYTKKIEKYNQKIKVSAQEELDNIYKVINERKAYKNLEGFLNKKAVRYISNIQNLNRDLLNNYKVEKSKLENKWQAFYDSINNFCKTSKIKTIKKQRALLKLIYDLNDDLLKIKYELDASEDNYQKYKKKSRYILDDLNAFYDHYFGITDNSRNGFNFGLDSNRIDNNNHGYTHSDSSLGRGSYGSLEYSDKYKYENKSKHSSTLNNMRRVNNMLASMRNDLRYEDEDDC